MGGLAGEERWVAAIVPCQGSSFFNPSKVLPLYCYLPLGNLEIKFIGCVQGIKFSGRWKHLEKKEEEGDEGSRERVGGNERGTKNNSIGQGISNSNNFKGQSQVKRSARGKLCAVCAGHVLALDWNRNK